ncbi:MAG TPA: aconitate hydratase, partial [Tahibacter sp.]|nr:aconitate hydratase [Tahibacter sp.]
IRLRNLLAPGTEGGFTRYLGKPGEFGEEITTIYDASVRYKDAGIPLVVLAGKDYGMGSSRDWAAKGAYLLGIKAVIAESFERIHRSNLVGMGVLPLQFKDGENAQTIGLKGDEVFEIAGLNDGEAREIEVVATGANDTKRFKVKVLLLTPKEVEYFRHGGILPYVLRQLASAPKAA